MLELHFIQYDLNNFHSPINNKIFFFGLCYNFLNSFLAKELYVVVSHFYKNFQNYFFKKRILLLFLLLFSYSLSAKEDVLNFNVLRNERSDCYFSEIPESLYLILAKLSIEDNLLGQGFLTEIDEKIQLITNEHITGLYRIYKSYAADISLDVQRLSSDVSIGEIKKSNSKYDYSIVDTSEEEIFLPDIFLREEELTDRQCIFLMSFTVDDNILISEGRVLLDEEDGDPFVFFHDADTAKGMSGSPIFDQNFRLVGFHVGKSKKGPKDKRPVNISSSIHTLFE